jgi:hypothetical protein
MTALIQQQQPRLNTRLASAARLNIWMGTAPHPIWCNHWSTHLRVRCYSTILATAQSSSVERGGPTRFVRGRPALYISPDRAPSFSSRASRPSICQVSLICLPDLGLLLLGLKATTMSYPPPGQQAYPPPPPAYAAPPPMAAGYPPQQDSRQVPGNTNDHNCLKAW